MNTYDWKNLEWPWNLLGALYDDTDPKSYPDDVEASLLYAVSSLPDERAKRMLIERFKNGRTLEQCAEKGIVPSKERARQIQNHGLRLLHHAQYHGIITSGLRQYISDVARSERARGYTLGYATGAGETAERLGRIMRSVTGKDPDIPTLDITIVNLDLSVRAYNCLKRAGVVTVRDILDLGPEKLKEVRNLGIKCYREIVGILKALGVNVDGYDI